VGCCSVWGVVFWVGVCLCVCVCGGGVMVALLFCTDMALREGEGTQSCNVGRPAPTLGPGRQAGKHCVGNSDGGLVGGH